MSGLSASVGQSGRNIANDVTTVQNLLVRNGMNPGPIDGVCGNKTIRAIVGFQSRFLSHPDGRVDPNGRTWRALNRSPTTSAPPTQPIARPTGAPMQWTGDSSQWSQAKKLQSLAASFMPKVNAVISRLSARGFQPHIIYGWRSVAVQQTLVAQGKSRVRFSFHNAQLPDGTPNAWAADIVDKRWLWREPDCMTFFNALGEEAKAQGLVWGGDWANFRDWAHIQGRQNGELALVKRESGL